MSDLIASPVYKSAPIIEAVLQIRVTADATVAAMEKVAHRLKKTYPNQSPMQNMEVLIDNTGGNIAVSNKSEGFRLANNDQTDICLINQRGITTARLPPYPGWQTLRDNAFAAWQEWKSATPRHPIERIGVRYINRIDIPTTDAIVMLGEYLNFAPNVTQISREALLTYMMQITIPTANPLWIATITSTTLGQTQIPKHHSLVLDIDLARTASISMNDADLWPMIGEAQGLKNDLFERCITPAARKLFNS